MMMLPHFTAVLLRRIIFLYFARSRRPRGIAFLTFHTRAHSGCQAGR
jgi:hypothetical protein